jgi:MoxR-like ATPase
MGVATATPMQTFLPYPDFTRSARALDDRRLGKQRVEALQIVRALTRPVYGWQHHPAVRMWRGHEEALGAYAVAICREWCRRGHADTCETKILADLAEAGLPVPPRSQAELRRARALPPWLGRRALHASHRAALVRKDPEHYEPRFGALDTDVPYVWPVPLGRP